MLLNLKFIHIYIGKKCFEINLCVLPFMFLLIINKYMVVYVCVYCLSKDTFLETKASFITDLFLSVTNQTKFKISLIVYTLHIFIVWNIKLSIFFNVLFIIINFVATKKKLNLKQDFQTNLTITRYQIK